jgi:hypothetical protein
MEEQLFPSTDLPVDDSAASCLKETSSWTRFLAICFVVVIGFMVLGLLGLIVAKDMIVSSLEKTSLPVGGLGVAVLIFVLAILIIIMAVLISFLFQFSNQTARGVIRQDQYALEKGISGLKNYLILSGVIAILSLIATLCKLFTL